MTGMTDTTLPPSITPEMAQQLVQSVAAIATAFGGAVTVAPPVAEPRVLNKKGKPYKSVSIPPINTPNTEAHKPFKRAVQTHRKLEKTAGKTRFQEQMPKTIYGVFEFWRKRGGRNGAHSEDYIRQMESTVRVFVEITDVTDTFALQPDHFIKLRDTILNERGRSPSTWNSYCRHLKALFRPTKRFGFDVSGLFDDIHQVPVHNRKKRIVEDRDLKKIDKFLDDPANFTVNPGWFWQSVLKTMYYTGMRRRQLVGLIWGDIDFRKRVILLRMENSKTDREWTVPMSKNLAESLLDLKERSEIQLKRRVKKEDQVFNVTHFTNRYRTDKKPATVMTREHVSSTFRRMKDACNVAISPHRLRHTFASKLATANGSLEGLREIQRMLGHTDIKTTLGYIEPDMKKMHAMVNGLDIESNTTRLNKKSPDNIF